MARTSGPPARFDRELLKGNTGTVVLAILAGGPLHGYQIAKEMRRRSDDALRLGQGVLYPILHRLEDRGLILGEWEQSTGTPSRKRYTITKAGLAELRAKRGEWAAFSSAMAKVLDTDGGAR
jgi:DNA-binding PadR family transcriptional regulator